VARTVHEVLSDAQRIGALGSRRIDEVIEHARAFVDALPPTCHRVIDLGSGAGVPGLIIADQRPELVITLVDRRAKRTDALERAVSALGWSQRIQVVCADVGALARNPEWRGQFDAVVSRGLGPHETTLRLSTALAAPGGSIILSEPPTGGPSRWDPALIEALGLTGPERFSHVARFIKKTDPL